MDGDGKEEFRHRARRTRSAWGAPPSRLYRLVSLVIAEGGQHVAVLGCSDGKFVMPFARHGIRVTAVDVDPIALWGGTKAFPDGDRKMQGLAWRLEQEGLSHLVSVIEADFSQLEDNPVHDLVFTSGSLHYRRNHQTSIVDLVSKLVIQAKPGGLVYIDYMRPIEDWHNSCPHFPKIGELRGIIEGLGCTVLHERYRDMFLERAHVEQPRDHFHNLGYILARRGKLDSGDVQ